MEESDSEVDDSIPIHQSEMYPIDFDDPPDELSDPSLILVWYTNGVAREIMTSSTWSDRIKNGWRPYFCLFKGFCACFKSTSELRQHYEDFQSHRLMKSDWQDIMANAKIIHNLRQWNFPRRNRFVRKDRLFQMIFN